MKFLCPSCKAKYQIADEKVSGRAVRMKCRKCGFVIPLSEVPPAPSTMPPGPDQSAAQVPKAPAAPSATGGANRTPPSAATGVATPQAVNSAQSAAGEAAGARRPTLADVKAPAKANPGLPSAPRVGSSSATAAPRPPTPRPKPTTGSAPLAAAAPRSSPSATSAVTQTPLPRSSPLAAPAPRSSPLAAATGTPLPRSSPLAASAPRSSPNASSTVAKATPSPAAPVANAAASAALLAAEEEEGDGTTQIVSGGALAAAFGALVASGSEPKSASASHEGHTADEWFVGINDVPVGPIRLAELRKRAMLGAITLESMVWRDGMEAWRPLRTFPELVAVLEESFSSVRASLVPPQRDAGAAAAALRESDPLGSGLSSGGIAGPVVAEDLAVAGLARTRTPLAAWLAIGVALALGMAIGFVFFSKQQPPETVVKYVEVPAKTAEQPAAAAPEAVTEAQAAASAAAKPRTGGKSVAGTKTPEAEKSGGLSGLKGLSGLSPSGPGSPGGSTPGSTPGGGGSQLDATQIQATVGRYTGSVKRSCWQPALDSRDPSAPSSARVVVTITVGPSGSVQGVSTSGEPRGYPGLASCISGRVRAWQFPATGGTTTVNVPFVFAAQ